MIFEYWRSEKDGLWYWHLKSAGNNKIFADGAEGYDNKNDLLTQVQNIRSGGAQAMIGEISDPHHG